MCLSPACTDPYWVSGKAHALETMPGDPKTLAGSAEAGKLKRFQETQRPASLQVPRSIILQLFASGSWTQATGKFVVITAPNMHPHITPLRVPHSESSTLSAISRGTGVLGLGRRPKLANDQSLQLHPTTGCCY